MSPGGESPLLRTTGEEEGASGGDSRSQWDWRKTRDRGVPGAKRGFEEGRHGQRLQRGQGKGRKGREAATLETCVALKGAFWEGIVCGVLSERQRSGES